VAPERFRTADGYRARREWLRYEGTGQRDLFRELRERFLARHAVDEGWVLDLGSGPGRFLPFAGRAGSRRVALDISREMLNLLPEAWAASGSTDPPPDRVRGDALHPPLVRGRGAEVIVFGNTLGFSGKAADRLLDEAERLVAPGGILVVEIAPALGPDALRIEAVRGDAKAWPHLLDLEEEVGRRPERWSEAAAVLLSARLPSSKRMVK